MRAAIFLFRKVGVGRAALHARRVSAIALSLDACCCDSLWLRVVLTSIDNAFLYRAADDERHSVPVGAPFLWVLLRPGRSILWFGDCGVWWLTYPPHGVRRAPSRVRFASRLAQRQCLSCGS